MEWLKWVSEVLHLASVSLNAYANFDSYAREGAWELNQRTKKINIFLLCLGSKCLFKKKSQRLHVRRKLLREWQWKSLFFSVLKSLPVLVDLEPGWELGLEERKPGKILETVGVWNIKLGLEESQKHKLKTFAVV